MSGLGDWLGLVLVVAIIFVLVRPGSPAVELVERFGEMLITLVRSATGQTS